MKTSKPDQYQDIRDAVRALCAEFPDSYHRQIDANKAYPEEFVNTLTKAGTYLGLHLSRGKKLGT
jgi:acyl-CoA dehydrogenase